jgi:ubiquinone/menaquinone biosynthesis C-methylase UbiE
MLVCAFALAVPAPGATASDFDALEYKLYVAYNDGDYALALQFAERLHGLRPEHADTLYNLAAVHSRLGNKDEAYAWLQKAAEVGGVRSRRMERYRTYIAMLEREERAEFQKPDKVMATLAFKPGERVADIGAGSGYFTIPVARAVGPAGKVWAIDVEQVMLDYIDRRLQAEKLENVELILVPRDDPQLAAGSVDTILMVDTFHYINDRVAYARKLRQALAPGGRVVIIDYKPRPWKERPWGPLPHQQFPREIIDADMAAAGLEPVRAHDFLTEQYFVEYGVPEKGHPGSP